MDDKDIDRAEQSFNTAALAAYKRLEASGKSRTEIAGMMGLTDFSIVKYLAKDLRAYMDRMAP